MSTAALATATGYSVQQVRDLEAHGVIPVARAVGPVEARRAMREIRCRPTDEAAALICSLHTRLNDERTQALAARLALESIRAEAFTEAEPVEGDSMTITELSQALGVRASTLRFWETAGLVSPERITTRAGTARRYPLTAIREARITAALRAGGYRIPDVQSAITAVRNLQDVCHTTAALETRLETIAQRALALLAAGTVLAETIESAR